jgi:hypothetical protein
VITALNGKLIDNLAPSRPYIYVDNSVKSCGVVFITDGVNWYVVGYYNSSGWDWTSTTNGGGIQLIASSSNDIKLTATNANAFYSLPISPTLSYLSVIKTQSIQSSGSGVRYCSFKNGDQSLQFFNESSKGIFYGGNQTNNCVWFVAQPEYTPSNPLVKYHPVIGYTP